MRTRRIHRPIRIDFTPLASVALLLIFFFVFLESRKRDSVMPLNIPGGIICQPGERALVDAHLFLLANDRIGFLQYTRNGRDAEFLEIGYAKNELEARLISMMLNHTYGAVVVITPTNESTYKNLVDVFNGINIIGDVRFSLNDYLTKEEKSLLLQYETYKARKPIQSVMMHLDLYPQWMSGEAMY